MPRALDPIARRCRRHGYALGTMRSSLRLGPVLVGVLLGILTASHARADSLAPPPTDCPQGTYGRSSRGGSYCAPTQCGDDTHTCPPQPHCPVQSWPCPSPEPWRCEDAPRGLCVLTSTSNGSRPGPRGPIPWTDEFTQSLGDCTTDADCTRGARCEIARRCVHAPAQTPTAPARTTAPAPTTTTAPSTTPTTSPASPRTNSSADASAGALCALTAHRSTGHDAGLALFLPALVLLSRRARQGARKRTSANGSGSRSNANVTA